MTPKLVQRRSERLQAKRLVCTCPITCTPKDKCSIKETPTAEYAFFKQHHSHCDPEKYSYRGLPVNVFNMGDPEYVVSKAKMPFYDMLVDAKVDLQFRTYIGFNLAANPAIRTWANYLWRMFGLFWVNQIVEGHYRHGIILHPSLVLKLAQEVQNCMYAEWFISPVPCAICHQIICNDYETTACCHHRIHPMCAWQENQNTCPVCKQSCVWRFGNLSVGKKN